LLRFRGHFSIKTGGCLSETRDNSFMLPFMYGSLDSLLDALLRSQQTFDRALLLLRISTLFVSTVGDITNQCDPGHCKLSDRFSWSSPRPALLDRRGLDCFIRKRKSFPTHSLLRFTLLLFSVRCKLHAWRAGRNNRTTNFLVTDRRSEVTLTFFQV
jgi:hypothetical protein